jgi:hypothetical protein
MADFRLEEAAGEGVTGTIYLAVSHLSVICERSEAIQFGLDVRPWPGLLRRCTPRNDAGPMIRSGLHLRSRPIDHEPHSTGEECMDKERQRRVKKRFGKRLRQLRETRDLTKALAAACALDPSYLGRIERGESNVTLVNNPVLSLSKGPPHCGAFGLSQQSCLGSSQSENVCYRQTSLLADTFKYA